MERLQIITTKALKVPVSTEEILDDLLYPARRVPGGPPRRRPATSQDKRR